MFKADFNSILELMNSIIDQIELTTERLKRPVIPSEARNLKICWGTACRTRTCASFEMTGDDKVKKADFVIRDDIDVPVGNKMPMWLVGMVF